MRPEAVVDQQVEAFNRHDAQAFANTYATDAVVVNVTSGSPPLVGREAIRVQYAAMFESLVDLRASVGGRIVVGDFVTDHEILPTLSAQAIAIYEVRAGLIQRAWLFGPLPADA